MKRMFNPPHPGKILRDALGDADVTGAARRLYVSRATLARILNDAGGISADMSCVCPPRSELMTACGTSCR